MLNFHYIVGKNAIITVKQELFSKHNRKSITLSTVNVVEIEHVVGFSLQPCIQISNGITTNSF